MSVLAPFLLGFSDFCDFFAASHFKFGMSIRNCIRNRKISRCKFHRPFWKLPASPFLHGSLDSRGFLAVRRLKFDKNMHRCVEERKISRRNFNGPYFPARWPPLWQFAALSRRAFSLIFVATCSRMLKIWWEYTCYRKNDEMIDKGTYDTSSRDNSIPALGHQFLK